MKTLLIIALSIFAVSDLSAFQKIKPVGQWTERHRDPTHADAGPENGMIANSVEFEELFQKWHPEKAVPVIDFESHLVLAATVGGPNRMMIPAKLDVNDGDVQFRPGATRMGGPGFGSMLVQIKRAGITSVNGVPIPDPDVPAAEGERDEEFVNVDMVGTLNTEVMAIGGETTGVVITSGEIEFELQVPEELMADARRMNEQKVNVKGLLTKKRGVEIAERWIVVVEAITALESEIEVPTGEVGITFKTIEVMQSGGIAGVMDKTTLHANGNMGGGKRLDADRMREIHAHVGSVKWDQIPRSTRARDVADDFQFDIAIDLGDRKYEFTVSGTRMNDVEAIKKLLRLMR